MTIIRNYTVQIITDNLCVLLQKLTNVRIMKENMRTGNLPANMKKARVIQIIPCKMINFIYRNKSYKYMAVLRLL